LTVVNKTIDDTLRDEQGETVDNLRQALEDDRKLVAQGLMTEDEFNQEWYNSFEAAIRGAYYSTQIAEARKNGRIKTVPMTVHSRYTSFVTLEWDRHFGAGFYQTLRR